jgi:hypothetical protein
VQILGEVGERGCVFDALFILGKIKDGAARTSEQGRANKGRAVGICGGGPLCLCLARESSGLGAAWLGSVLFNQAGCLEQPLSGPCTLAGLHPRALFILPGCLGTPCPSCVDSHIVEAVCTQTLFVQALFSLFRLAGLSTWSQPLKHAFMARLRLGWLAADSIPARVQPGLYIDRSGTSTEPALGQCRIVQCR